MVTLSSASVTPEILAHGTSVLVGEKEGTVTASATYRGTDIDIGLTYGSTNDRNGTTPNPSKSWQQNIVGSALFTCLSQTTAFFVSPWCSLIQTSKLAAVLPLPLPCEQTVRGHGAYVARLTLSMGLSTQYVSIPVNLSTPSPVANDNEVSASSPKCLLPVAHFRMEGPNGVSADGGTLNEQAPSGQVAIGLWSTSTIGSTEIKSYQWTANGNTIGTEAGFNWLASPGDYTVTLTITDAAGLKSSVAGQVTVRSSQDVEMTPPPADGGSNSDGATWTEPRPSDGQTDLPGSDYYSGSYWCQTTEQWVGRDETRYYEEITDCYPA